MRPGITLVVVTRLAVRLPGRDLPSAEWLGARYRILERLTVPALSASPVPLCWVVLCDPELAAGVADTTGALTTAWGPPLVVPDDASPTDVARLLGRSATGPIVSIRLDSDDAWLPDALGWMARVGQDAADGTLLDAPHGYQYDTTTGATTSLTFGPSHQGPFLGIRHDDPASAIDVGGDHRMARTGRPVLRYGDAGWVQVVHGSNVANRSVAPPGYPGQLIRLIKGMASGPRYARAWARSGTPTPRPEILDPLAAAEEP